MTSCRQGKLLSMDRMTEDEYKAAGFLTFSDLVKRGWTDHMKRKLLGKPEKMIRLNRGPNTYKNGKIWTVYWPNVGVWQIDKVVAAEALPEWKKMHDKAVV